VDSNLSPGGGADGHPCRGPLSFAADQIQPGHVPAITGGGGEGCIIAFLIQKNPARPTSVDRRQALCGKQGFVHDWSFVCNFLSFLSKWNLFDLILALAYFAFAMIPWLSRRKFAAPYCETGRISLPRNQNSRRGMHYFPSNVRVIECLSLTNAIRLPITITPELGSGAYELLPSLYSFWQGMLLFLHLLHKLGRDSKVSSVAIIYGLAHFVANSKYSEISFSQRQTVCKPLGNASRTQAVHFGSRRF